MGELVIATSTQIAPAVPADPTYDDVIRALVPAMSAEGASTLPGRRQTSTAITYGAALRQFFGWRGREFNAATVQELCALKTGQMALLLNEYKAWMHASGLAASTINVRLSAVRSLVMWARRYGLTELHPGGLVDSEKRVRGRVRGPSAAEVGELLASPDRESEAGLRDFAMMTVLWLNALRRAELCNCDIEDFDERRRRLTITRKGQAGLPKTIDLHVRCVDAIVAYLDVRSGGRRLDNGTPLFANFSRSKPGRLTPDGLRRVMRAYGAMVLERPINPHEMRHAAGTELYKATGNILAVKKLMDHARVETSEVYIDMADNAQLEASETLARIA